MPSRDVNAVTRLAEASWWRDNYIKYDTQISYISFSILVKVLQHLLYFF